jgi:hypothetical protein
MRLWRVLELELVAQVLWNTTLQLQLLQGKLWPGLVWAWVLALAKRQRKCLLQRVLVRQRQVREWDVATKTRVTTFPQNSWCVGG